MNLTAPAARRRPASPAAPRALTTEPGFTNPNRQRVVLRTGAPSASRENQVIYRLHCNACGHEYGCNGLDIKTRLCPACQQGSPGEPLREPQPTLFG